MKKNVVIVAGAVAVVITVAVLLLLQLMIRGKIDEPVSVDPAIEREVVEKDRVILRTKIAAVFPHWVQAWRSRNARFAPSALKRDGIELMDSSLVTREDHVHVPLDDESLHAHVSPDGTKYLEYTGGGEDAEPDSELSLVDAARSERRRLLFYGPSVRLDDAVWVDDETILVVGEGDEETGSRAGAVQPLVWIFHLPRNLVSTYTAIEN
jgi:hypothetical protein